MDHSEIHRRLAAIGGQGLVSSFKAEHEKSKPEPLPYAPYDGFSVGYALAIGGMASALDLILDSAFRKEMQHKHRLADADDQKAMEDAVTKRMDEMGLEGSDESGNPKMAIDWWKGLNDILGLKPPYKLRPANHRMLNHTNAREAIEMLMRGEGGFGDLRFKLWPTMTYEQAKELYELHLAADRTSPQSLPLRFMSWFWEQGIKSADTSGKLGAPSGFYKLFERLTPGVDWSKWINRFYGKEGLIPEGATFGEAMLKLYDAGVLNERVFWTSDLGAAVGGFKRRAIITACMEIGVEIFALLEGVKAGYIKWDGDIESLKIRAQEWRDQPKYLDMKIIAQVMASSGGLVRGVIKGDALNMNFSSIAMMSRHIWVYPATEERYHNRLVQKSTERRQQLLSNFSARTGIDILSDEMQMLMHRGEMNMGSSLDSRIIKARCQSTRVRVLAKHHPEEMADIVARFERLHVKSDGIESKEDAYDSICDSWYLSDITDDAAAIKKLKSDLTRVEKLVL